MHKTRHTINCKTVLMRTLCQMQIKQLHNIYEYLSKCFQHFIKNKWTRASIHKGIRIIIHRSFNNSVCTTQNHTAAPPLFTQSYEECMHTHAAQNVITHKGRRPYTQAHPYVYTFLNTASQAHRNTHTHNYIHTYLKIHTHFCMHAYSHTHTRIERH